MAEAEAVAVAGTDVEVSSNPKVVLGVPINATKKKYMRILSKVTCNLKVYPSWEYT